jgi:hypothetical protein
LLNCEEFIPQGFESPYSRHSGDSL